MIPLGHISRGPRDLASRVTSAVRAKGGVAVFLGRNGEGAAVPYTDPSYDWALRRHIRHLVGIYQDDLASNSRLHAHVVSDLREHERDMRKAA